MSVENSKKLTFWPPFAHFLHWLLNVQYYRNSILIIISDYALVSVGGVRFDDAVLLLRAFSFLKIRQFYVRHLKRLTIISTPITLRRFFWWQAR
jgi:hypothetical protein